MDTVAMPLGVGKSRALVLMRNVILHLNDDKCQFIHYVPVLIFHIAVSLTCAVLDMHPKGWPSTSPQRT